MSGFTQQVVATKYQMPLGWKITFWVLALVSAVSAGMLTLLVTGEPGDRSTAFIFVTLLLMLPAGVISFIGLIVALVMYSARNKNIAPQASVDSTKAVGKGRAWWFTVLTIISFGYPGLLYVADSPLLSQPILRSLITLAMPFYLILQIIFMVMLASYAARSSHPMKNRLAALLAFVVLPVFFLTIFVW